MLPTKKLEWVSHINVHSPKTNKPRSDMFGKHKCVCHSQLTGSWASEKHISTLYPGGQVGNLKLSHISQ